jgi:hypothetical protein
MKKFMQKDLPDGLKIVNLAIGAVPLKSSRFNVPTF